MHETGDESVKLSVIVVVFLTTFLCLGQHSSASDASTYSTLLDSKNWAVNCEKFREFRQTMHGSELKFSGPRTGSALHYDPAKLGPPLQIDSMYFPSLESEPLLLGFSRTDDETKLILRNEEGHYLVVSDQPLASVTNYWGVESVNRKGSLQELSEELFGSSFHFEDLMLDAFRLTPDDMACEGRTYLTDLKVYLTLAMKLPHGPQGFVSEFSSGDYRGWIKADTKTGVQVMAINGDRLVTVDYSNLSNREDYWGYLINRLTRGN